MSTAAFPKKIKNTRQHSKRPKFLKPGEVRQMLGISDETLRKLTRTGVLDHYVIGSQLRFTKQAVDAYLAVCRNAKARPKAA